MYFLPFTVFEYAPYQTQSLKTRWANSVDQNHPHSEYPRPSMVRSNGESLNGKWDFAMQPPSVSMAGAFEDASAILVPFPVESQLSGVKKRVPKGHKLWYRRSFTPPKGERVLLHFGAVDWEAVVWVNGVLVGSHKGGFDSFSFDISKAVAGKKGMSEIVVCATDPTDAGQQPRGKQVEKPGGIFYTPTSGIWQTVWTEGVARSSIESLRFSHRGRSGVIDFSANTRGEQPASMEVQVLDGKKVVYRTKSQKTSAAIAVKNPKLWTPDRPFLYDVLVSFRDKSGKLMDSVKSYTAFRTFEIGKDAAGITRMMLNGKPTFFCGPLDQGFWPDGLYTAPSDAAMKYDLEVTKKLGFNTIRKHVKVEPETFYAACDRMGIVVFQDMPSGSGFINGKDKDIVRTPDDAVQFKAELKALIDTHRNHPSIAMWVVFNEGWGQHDTVELSRWVKAYDPTRFVNHASGWTDRGAGDVNDIHNYPPPAVPKLESKRAAMLGEFGGLGLPQPGHMWKAEGWGYQSYKTNAELTDAMENLFLQTRLLIGEKGLCSAIYTQTTDVETELNGFMTYDREILKVDSARISRAVRNLYLAPPKTFVLVPTSEKVGQKWSYSLVKPTEGWAATSFDASSWSSGLGPFASAGTPGIRVGTAWSSSDIWLRRTVTLDRPVKANELALSLYHDEDVEVYFDGVLMTKQSGYASSYSLIPVKLSQQLAAGPHVIAVHCHQTKGGQGVDVGLIRLSASTN